MVNDTDKQLLAEITKVFDTSAQVLVDLNEEIVTHIEPKFGTAGALTKKKREQLDTLRGLYDKSLNYINYLRDLNHKMYTEFMTTELLRYQKQTGLPISKIMELAGRDPGKWREVDEWDAKIKRIKEMLNIPEELNAEFEEYIKALSNDRE